MSAFVSYLQADEKKKLLRKFPYFKITVVVGSGKDLIAMDRGGEKQSLNGDSQKKLLS